MTTWNKYNNYFNYKSRLDDNISYYVLYLFNEFEQKTRLLLVTEAEWSKIISVIFVFTE